MLHQAFWSRLGWILGWDARVAQFLAGRPSSVCWELPAWFSAPAICSHKCFHWKANHPFSVGCDPAALRLSKPVPAENLSETGYCWTILRHWPTLSADVRKDPASRSCHSLSVQASGRSESATPCQFWAAGGKQAVFTRCFVWVFWYRRHPRAVHRISFRRARFRSSKRRIWTYSQSYPAAPETCRERFPPKTSKYWRSRQAAFARGRNRLSWRRGCWPVC